MRGKREVVEPVLVDAGITPAHAGKTLKKAHQPQALEDHPRACGENST